jgi:hypothetical protein
MSKADAVRAMFARDAALSNEYNHQLENGKWDHMMDQTHIGYTAWNDPPANVMPAVSWIQVPERGIARRGSGKARRGASGRTVWFLAGNH